MNSSERHKMREQRRKLKRQRKEYVRQEKETVKKQKREFKEKRALMRRKVRSMEIDTLEKRFKKFLKELFKQKKIRKSDRIIRQQVKYDIKKQRIRRLHNLPKRLTFGIGRIYSSRKEKLKVAYFSVLDFLYLIRYISKEKELRWGFLKTLVNSTFLFVLAFFVIYFLSQLITIYIAQLFDIPTVLYSYRIFWPLYTYSTLYTRMALIVIFGTGPFVCLLIGIVFYRIFLWIRRFNLIAKTFLLWLVFHAFNMFFGSYIVGVITRTGFIYTTEWLFLSDVFDTEEIVFLIVSIVVLVIIGYFSTKHFISATNSSPILEPKLRLHYLISIALLPWFLGNSVLYFLNFPHNPFELSLLYLVSILMIIPIFTNYNSLLIQMIKLPQLSTKSKYGWIYIIVTIIVVISIRLIIFKGIKFG